MLSQVRRRDRFVEVCGCLPGCHPCQDARPECVELKIAGQGCEELNKLQYDRKKLRIPRTRMPCHTITLRKLVPDVFLYVLEAQVQEQLLICLSAPFQDSIHALAIQKTVCQLHISFLGMLEERGVQEHDVSCFIFRVRENKESWYHSHTRQGPSLRQKTGCPDAAQKQAVSVCLICEIQQEGRESATLENIMRA